MCTVIYNTISNFLLKCTCCSGINSFSWERRSYKINIHNMRLWVIPQIKHFWAVYCCPNTLMFIAKLKLKKLSYTTNCWLLNMNNIWHNETTISISLNFITNYILKFFSWQQKIFLIINMNNMYLTQWQVYDFQGNSYSEQF